MDLRLHFRVLSRFRYLVIGGLILAVALAFFSYFRVDLHGFKINPRQDETWQSSEVFLLTQKNSSLFTANPDASGSSGATSWLMTLPGFYAQIANSDVVGDVIRANHSLHGTYDAYQLFSSRGQFGAAVSPVRRKLGDPYRRSAARERGGRDVPQLRTEQTGAPANPGVESGRDPDDHCASGEARSARSAAQEDCSDHRLPCDHHWDSWSLLHPREPSAVRDYRSARV